MAGREAPFPFRATLLRPLASAGGGGARAPGARAPLPIWDLFRPRRVGMPCHAAVPARRTKMLLGSPCRVLGGEGREGSVSDGKGIEVRGALGDGVLRRHAEVGSIISQPPAPVLFTETTHKDKMFNRRHSLNLPEQLPSHCSRKATERIQKATSKSVADLVGEIAALEQEVIRKELHLLSLYRRAFDQYVSEPCSFTSEEVPKSGARHSSLVNFLSASISEYVPKISCKLSEDILSCIGAVYCKLSSTQPQDAECMTSPSPSVSSSSTFSPRRRNDSWSPRYNFDSPRQYEFQKEKNEQNVGMIVIPRIRIDADKFDYASKMLETIRSLIQRLEKVDPLKMTHEEQLCFWINIHNALVMHAFLAYGLHDKRMKSTDMILKAAYNVGGQSVNAQIIQNSILGCQSHRPSLWVRALFTPSKRSTAGTARHPYALHHPEPIAHFALSTGAFSDPPVRLYTAKKIHQQLEAARTEFIQGSVVVRKQALLLPKVLHYYARDAALELRHLVELVCESMSDAQREHCPRRRADRCVEWMPYKSSFRYVVHRDLAD
ncbi:hypothetical protein C2845_PM04G20050 [Panicum miliaceum]|uniref:DUF547 domain-containing protein n=1 Tax=Panicum miliaceum TaxID=4540 RepID=A0A3L6QWP0_PANMI|nr:hypothetical protein C2845_PM04G20050 [Panicum miliaceum]